ncbi:MAG: PBSX family phage terminase large subunit [Methylomicrobium sp.]|nr:PBSX family phage terminase large subunit [Methylomicrobium sp.]
MSAAYIDLPPKLVPVFTPQRGELRFRGAYGGRGGGKSFSFALMAAVFGYSEPLRILCTREYQVSIRESMHAEIANAIKSLPWLRRHYKIERDVIRGKNGTVFIFKGLRHNVSNIKSMAQIDICIVDEASDIPEHSWRALLPTIRAPRSEVWVLWNPKREVDPVENLFRANTPPRAEIAQINYDDNPYLSDELNEQRLFDRSVMDPLVYGWIWGGEYLKRDKSLIFSGRYRVAEFEHRRNWDGPYIGMDHGFSVDPLAVTESWVHDKTLYIERECGGVGIELEKIAPLVLRTFPGIDRHIIYADNARPEVNNYLKRNGLHRLRSVKKYKGSVETGIVFMQSFREIVIHPRCAETIKEFGLYSYKIDRLSGEVLPDIEDKNNHGIDAIRYGLSPIIERSRYNMYDLTST